MECRFYCSQLTIHVFGMLIGKVELNSNKQFLDSRGFNSHLPQVSESQSPAKKNTSHTRHALHAVAL